MGRVLLADMPPLQLQRYLDGAVLHPRTAKTITSKNELEAMLKSVRRSGFAIVDQELELGLRSIAVPVRDRQGTVIASINVGAQSTRISVKELTQRVLPELRTAADELAQRL